MPVHAQNGWWKDAGGQVMASPLLADLDEDRRMEVLVPALNDVLHVFAHDGSAYAPVGAKWPVNMGFRINDEIYGTAASVAVGDVDGQPGLEIVVVGREPDPDPALRKPQVKVFDTLGNLKAERSLTSPATVKATPTLIDCYRYTSEGRHLGQEILLCDGNGLLHVIYWDSTTSMPLQIKATFQTCSSSSQQDSHDRFPITSSAAAAYVAEDKTWIAVGSTDGAVYRWEITSNSGNNWSAGSPVLLEPVASPNPVYFLSSPVLADLDGNGSIETIVGGTDSKVYVWNSDGNKRAGWPRITGQPVVSSPAVADIDGDSKLEIAVGCDDGGIYAWRENGAKLNASWDSEFVTTFGDVIASPIMAEIDGSAGLELIGASLDGFLYAWDRNGDLLPKWPKRLNTPLPSAPSVGDIHGGGRKAVVIAGSDGRIFVFDLADKYVDAPNQWPQFRGGALRRGSF